MIDVPAIFPFIINIVIMALVIASTWEIRDLNTSGSSMTRCLVTQMLEIHSSGWFRWKKNHSSKFEKSVPYALLCQVSG